MSAKLAQQWLDEGLDHFERGQVAPAEEAGRQALELEPENAEALHLLGMVELAKGRAKQAVEYLRRAVAAWPEDAEFHNNLGVALRALEHAEEAEQCFRKATTLDPGNALAHYNLGMSFKTSGSAAEAEQQFRAAIELDSRIPAFHLELGIVLANQQQLEDAIACWRKVLELDPQSGQAHLYLANGLCAMGQIEQAAAAVQRAAELLPSDPRPHYVHGAILLTQRQYEAARQQFGAALALDKNCVPALNGLANLLYVCGRFADAAEAARRAVAVAPGSAEAFYTLGIALEELGKKNEAGTCFRTASRLRPDLERLRYIAAGRSPRHGAPASAPADYVRTLFDEYAPKFDRHLRDVLKYRVPELLLEAARSAGAGGELEVLDLGCGTGLVGQLFRPMARLLVGVDLSPEMLAQAKQRGVYDELAEADLTTFLAGTRQQFDLVTAADVFIYIGDLAEIFAQIARVLRSGGLFVFSVEAGQEDGYRLQPSRRYAHGRPYLEKLAAENHFDVVQFRSETLRHDDNIPTAGWIVVLRHSRDA